MALTAQQMIEMFTQQAMRTSMGLTAARNSSNYQLAALNCRQGFKLRLMRGLIQWRAKESPLESFSEALAFHKAAYGAMQEISGADTKLTDSSVERVGLIAYLMGADWQLIDVSGFESDRLLDAALSNWLYGEIDEKEWQKGMTQLSKTGSRLAIETYNKYKLLIDSKASEKLDFTNSLVSFFQMRKKDKFFSGGDQTEGGGNDNDFTVDYRFGAILKKLQVNSGSDHDWRW